MSNKQIGTLVVVLLVVILAAFVMIRPHDSSDDSLGARMDRAAGEISEGVAGAAKEMKPESQKTVGEKVGEAVEDAGKEIRGTAQ
jgi:hypothetical protein